MEAQIKLLEASLSKDVTRYHLMHLHCKDDYFFTTDGHRLHAVRALTPKPEGVYNFTSFKAGHYDKEEATPINWMQLIRSITNVKPIGVHFPSWLKDIKMGRTQPDAIGIKANGHFTTDDDALAFFNPFYLKSFAGLDVKVWIKDSLSPMRIDIDKESFAIIMPVRRPR